VAMKLGKRLREVEPFLRTAASFVERTGNALTFADGPASTAFFLCFGAVALVLSASLFLLSILDPGLSFFYGAVALVALARPPEASASNQSGSVGVEPLRVPRAFNRAFACIPDEAELVHRFIAGRVQCSDAEGGPPVKVKPQKQKSGLFTRPPLRASGGGP